LRVVNGLAPTAGAALVAFARVDNLGAAVFLLAEVTVLVLPPPEQLYRILKNCIVIHLLFKYNNLNEYFRYFIFFY
jgi:hypothetical protein